MFYKHRGLCPVSEKEVCSLMFWIDLLIAFVVALIVASVLITMRNRRGSEETGRVWAGFWVVFLIILLAAWAGGLWLTPFGPLFMGAHWLPVVIVAVLTALLLLGLPYGDSPAKSPGASRGAKISFFALLIVLLGVVVLGYVG